MSTPGSLAQVPLPRAPAPAWCRLPPAFPLDKSRNLGALASKSRHADSGEGPDASFRGSILCLAG